MGSGGLTPGHMPRARARSNPARYRATAFVEAPGIMVPERDAGHGDSARLGWHAH